MISLHGFLGRGADVKTFGSFTPDLFAPGADFLPAEGFEAFCSKFLATAAGDERVLFGYSFGGRLALHLAMAAPERWDRVILVSTSPGLLTPEEKLNRQASDDRWAKKFLEMPWAQVLAEWNGQEVFKGSREPERFEGDYDRELLARALAEYSWAKMQMTPGRLMRLQNVQWVVGERDTKYMQMFAELRESRVIKDISILPAAGHRAIFDNPGALAALVAQGY